MPQECLMLNISEYSIIWFYAVYSCCPFVLLNSVLCYDFILDMVYYGIIFINRKTARKRHNSWGFAVTSFWGRAKWPSWPRQASQCTTLPGSSLFRCLSLDEESHGWCNFMVFSSWRRSRSCRQLLFNIFKTKVPTTVPQNSSCFFLVHYEST